MMPSPALRALGAAFAAAALLGAAPRSADVALQTAMGTIVLRVETARAPRAAAAFLRHVDAHDYDGGSFYRAVRPVFGKPLPRIGIIQGGIARSRGEQAVAAMRAVPLESTTQSGLHNVRGTVAMARSDEPDSARSEFFINLADDRWLDAQQFPDHRGYAVFARVVRGLDVADRIRAANAEENAMGEALAPPVTILRARRVR